MVTASIEAELKSGRERNGPMLCCCCWYGLMASVATELAGSGRDIEALLLLVPGLTM